MGGVAGPDFTGKPKVRSAAALAPTDCENANPNDVVLVFAAGLSEAQIVHAIAYGVSFGLDPVASETDVMDPVVGLAEQRAFESRCEPLSTLIEPMCRSESAACPEGTQSSFDAFMEALSAGV